jgi:hypothetical protein
VAVEAAVVGGGSTFGIEAAVGVSLLATADGGGGAAGGGGIRGASSEAGDDGGSDDGGGAASGVGVNGAAVGEASGASDDGGGVAAGGNGVGGSAAASLVRPPPSCRTPTTSETGFELDGCRSASTDTTSRPGSKFALLAASPTARQ